MTADMFAAIVVFAAMFLAWVVLPSKIAKRRQSAEEDTPSV